MIVNSASTSYTFQQDSAQRQQESAEARQILKRTPPAEIVDNSGTNNELPRTQTVNETNNVENSQRLSQNQERSQEVTKERVQIQQGRQDPASSLGQNIDIVV